MSLGQQMKAYRLEQDVSQCELATELNVATGWIDDYETDQPELEHPVEFALICWAIDIVVEKRQRELAGADQ